MSGYVVYPSMNHVVFADMFDNFIIGSIKTKLPKAGTLITRVNRHFDCVVFFDALIRDPIYGGTIVGIIKRSDLEDPLFWNQPLNQEWLSELLEMIKRE